MRDEEEAHRAVARVVRYRGRATAVEYALMVALIAMTVILAVTFVGRSTNTLFQDVLSAVSST